MDIHLSSRQNSAAYPRDINTERPPCIIASNRERYPCARILGRISMTAVILFTETIIP
jgi:hypothetical protein